MVSIPVSLLLGGDHTVTGIDSASLLPRTSNLPRRRGQVHSITDSTRVPYWAPILSHVFFNWLIVSNSAARDRVRAPEYRVNKSVQLLNFIVMNNPNKRQTMLISKWFLLTLPFPNLIRFIDSKLTYLRDHNVLTGQRSHVH